MESAARSEARAKALARPEASVAELKEALRSAKAAEKQAEAEAKRAAKGVERATLELEDAKGNVKAHKKTERKAEQEASMRASAEQEAAKAAEAAAKEAGKAAARQGLKVLSLAGKHLPVCEEGSASLSLSQVRRCTCRECVPGTSARQSCGSRVCVGVLHRRCASSSPSCVRRVSSAFTTLARGGVAGSWAGALLKRRSLQVPCHP